MGGLAPEVERVEVHEVKRRRGQVLHRKRMTMRGEMMMTRTKLKIHLKHTKQQVMIQTEKQAPILVEERIPEEITEYNGRR